MFDKTIDHHMIIMWLWNKQLTTLTVSVITESTWGSSRSTVALLITIDGGCTDQHPNTSNDQFLQCVVQSPSKSNRWASSGTTFWHKHNSVRVEEAGDQRCLSWNIHSWHLLLITTHLPTETQLALPIHGERHSDAFLHKQQQGQLNNTTSWIIIIITDNRICNNNNNNNTSSHTDQDQTPDHTTTLLLFNR